MNDQTDFPPIDKSAWPRGTWDEEPDFERFEHAGLSCVLRRNPSSGTWCGYVQVPQGHALAGAEYQTLHRHETEENELVVHGGLTFGGKSRYGEGWWFGFDCNHYGDFAPGYAAQRAKVLGACAAGPRYGESYASIDYARSHARRLATFIASV
jgi:hypothetical protein